MTDHPSFTPDPLSFLQVQVAIVRLVTPETNVSTKLTNVTLTLVSTHSLALINSMGEFLTSSERILKYDAS